VFNKLKKIGFTEFNEQYFGGALNWNTFKQWRKRKTKSNNKVKQHFIPLWFIIKLSEIFPKFTIDELEKNIIAYKGPSSSSIIVNPKFPLQEDYRLMKIIAHFLGDGSVGGGFGSGLLKGKQHSEYRNFTPDLLDRFEEDLSVFGKVPTSKNYKHGNIILPNSIGYILQHIYKIKFDTFNSRLPVLLFFLPRKLIAAFLRAFGDDEGHVYDSSVEYYSNNKELLRDILKLINQKFPELKTSLIQSNHSAGKNTKFSLKFYSTSQESYLALIGFDHKQKSEDLKFNMKRRRDKRRRVTESELLRTLINKELSAKQISRLVGTRHSSVLSRLNKLNQQGEVEIVRKEHWANIWRLKNKHVKI